MTKAHTEEAAEAHAVAPDLAQRIRDAIEGNPNSAMQVAAIIEILNGEHEPPRPPAYPDPTAAAVGEDDAPHATHGRRRHV